MFGEKMNTKNRMIYKVADTVFSLDTVHNYSHVRLAGYRSGEVPQTGIVTTDGAIFSPRRAERVKALTAVYGGNCSASAW